jgi:uncharacterized protein (TIGR03437 family)
MIGDQSFTVVQGVAGSTAVPSFSAAGVVDPWTYSTGITAGEWVTIFGSGLATRTAQWNPKPQSLLATDLGGSTVFFDGLPSALVYASPGQISALVPVAVQAGAVTITVRSGGLVSTPAMAQAGATHPVVFATLKAASNPPISYITAVDPVTGELLGASEVDAGVTRGARPGETIDLYTLGLGATQTPLITDQLFLSAFPVSAMPSVQLGPTAITPVFAGLISPGLYVIRIVVPNSASGDLSLVISVGGVSSAATTLLRVSP